MRRHLDEGRPGGRASQRSGDFVRRRCFRRRAGHRADPLDSPRGADGGSVEAGGLLSAAGAAAGAAGEAARAFLVSPVTSMQGVKCAAQFLVLFLGVASLPVRLPRRAAPDRIV